MDHRIPQRNRVSKSGYKLAIKAQMVTNDEGKSRKSPFLAIKYHSGAIDAKQQVTLTDEYPLYIISGMFKAPVAKGTWPAFWLTSVDSWPPECDILEYKGDSINWQNTFYTPKNVATIKKPVPTAFSQWHRYKAILNKINHTDVDVSYYIDDTLTGKHRCSYMNKPL
jgi:hypothetical protein